MSIARALPLAPALLLASASVVSAQGGAAPAPSARPPAAPAPAASAPAAPTSTAPAFDAELARQVGADERGMRSYVLVILKTGPTRVADGPDRDAMFAGHFANIERLAAAGKLAVAGPFAGGTDGWRGLYVFAVTDVEEARRLVATDPVVVKGEMVAEFHPWYGTAALMTVPDTHKRLLKTAR